MLERWNSVFRAKWFCWEVNRPGEVFRRVSGKKSGQKTAEIDWDFENFQKNASNFQLFLNQLLSDLDENLYTHSSWSAQQ